MPKRPTRPPREPGRPAETGRTARRPRVDRGSKRKSTPPTLTNAHAPAGGSDGTAPASEAEPKEPEVLGPEEEDDEPELIEDADPDLIPADEVVDDEEPGPVLDVGATPSLPVRRAEPLAPSATALERFLQQMGRYPLLSPEEEQSLTSAVYERGDPIAARKLVVHNLRLVVKMAYRYRRAWANILDLIQEGNVGLVEAVRRFDPFKGARFSTYASYWIRAYMIRYLLDHSRMVRISRTRAGRKLFFRLSRERESLRALGVEPGPKLLAERLGVSQQDFEEVVKHMDQPEVRLDAPLSHDGEGGDTVLDTLSSPIESPEAATHRAEMTQDVADALESFAKTLEDPRERAAWNEHLMAEDPIPLSSLGARFGVTKQRMGQIVMGMRKRLRDHLVATLGPDVQLDYDLELD